MEYKQIFNRNNGEPKIVGINEEGEYSFDMFTYTDVAPSSGLYGVIYFDGDKWIGSSKEEWESELPPVDPYQPSNSEMQQAMTQMQLTKTAVQLQKSQKELANVVIESAKKDERLQVLEQQAETLIEIAKLKGEN